MQTVTVLDLRELLADVAHSESKILYGVSWDDYIEFSKENLDKTELELTYNRGVLKVNMGQGFRHENLSRFLNSLITAVSLMLRIEIIPVGSMTLASSRIRKGADPDESYYIQNADSASFKRELFDDATDTPPDLVVEIDETHKSDEKFEIYAAFGIKEFWLYDAEVLRIFKLSETGEYLLSENSLALPILTAEVLSGFLGRSQRENQFKVLQDFQSWLEENR